MEEAQRHCKERVDMVKTVNEMKEDLFYQQCAAESIQARIIGISKNCKKEKNGL